LNKEEYAYNKQDMFLIKYITDNNIRKKLIQNNNMIKITTDTTDLSINTERNAS
jgi:hypothetical protein